MQVAAVESVQHGAQTVLVAVERFVLLGRAVFHSAEYYVRIVVLGRQVFHCVQNDEIFVGEDDVGIAVHYLREQIKNRVVLHLRAGGEFNAYYAVFLKEKNFFRNGRGKIFPEQHTERGSADGILFFRSGEVHTRSPRVAGHDEAQVFSRRTEKEAYFVRLGLNYFVRSRTFERGIEFRRKCAKRYAVAAHTDIIHGKCRLATQNVLI